MKGKDILLGLGYVDEQLVQEAQTCKVNKSRSILKYAMPIAASIAIVVLSTTLYQSGSNIPSTTSSPDILPPTVSGSKDDTNTAPSYKLQLGDATMVSASRIAVKGHFWHGLDAEQAGKVLPIISQNYEMEGTAHYSSANNQASLYEISAAVIINEQMSGKITVSPKEIVKDYMIVGEPGVSQIEGIPIEAGLFVTDKNSRGEQNYIYYADFKMDDIFYYLELVSENKEAEDAFTSMAADIIIGGKADLSIFDNPTIPKIIEKSLTETEAYNEEDFGKYLIKMPSGYLFNSANRLLNQNSDLLIASWSKGYEDVGLQVSRLDKGSRERIVQPKDITLFDMSLYPIPWADSMPKDKYHIIENPVFKMEDLTLDMIKLRGHTRGEAGDPSGNSLSMQFSVLYNDIVVEVYSEGLSAEYLFDELTALTIK